MAHKVEVRPRHALLPPQRPQTAPQVLPHVDRVAGGQVVHVIVPVVNLRQTKNEEMKQTAGLTLDQWARSDQSTRMTAWLRSKLSIQAAARKILRVTALLAWCCSPSTNRDFSSPLVREANPCVNILAYNHQL